MNDKGPPLFLISKHLLIVCGVGIQEEERLGERRARSKESRTWQQQEVSEALPLDCDFFFVFFCSTLNSQVTAACLDMLPDILYKKKKMTRVQNSAAAHGAKTFLIS